MKYNSLNQLRSKQKARQNKKDKPKELNIKKEKKNKNLSSFLGNN